MQVVKYSLIFILVFYFSFLILSPKRELYYALEKKIARSGVIIDGEKVKETALGVELKEPTIIYEGIKVAKVDMVKIVSMVVYSKITILNIQNDKAMRNILPLLPKNIIIEHNILSPYRLNILAYGDFGIAKGIFDIKSMTIRVYIIKPNNIDSIKRYLKKDKNGWYYEEKF